VKKWDNKLHALNRR